MNFVTAKSISRPSGEDMNPRLRSPIFLLSSSKSWLLSYS